MFCFKMLHQYQCPLQALCFKLYPNTVDVVFMDEAALTPEEEIISLVIKF